MGSWAAFFSGRGLILIPGVEVCGKTGRSVLVSLLFPSDFFVVCPCGCSLNFGGVLVGQGAGALRVGAVFGLRMCCVLSRLARVPPTPLTPFLFLGRFSEEHKQTLIL